QLPGLGDRHPAVDPARGQPVDRRHDRQLRQRPNPRRAHLRAVPGHPQRGLLRRSPDLSRSHAGWRQRGRPRVARAPGEPGRDDRAPFRVGNLLGTWLTALRIGDLAYLSMPGEPFPEVRFDIVQQTNAKTVVALSKGQDDFGYFYPTYDYVFPELYNSDHTIF